VGAGRAGPAVAAREAALWSASREHSWFFALEAGRAYDIAMNAIPRARHLFLGVVLSLVPVFGSMSAAPPAPAVPVLLEGLQRSCAARQWNPGHGLVVLPVAQAILALRDSLPEIQRADTAVTQVAALLHDIGGGGPQGEITGPPRARELLAEQPGGAELAERVCRIIATHHHLQGELSLDLADTPEWFVVVIADRPEVIQQYQRAPQDREALAGMVRQHIATLRRNLRWTSPSETITGFAGASAPATTGPESSPEMFLPPAPTGRPWKLVWQDEFEGDTLDETRWNRLGDWKRRDGYWVKEDAYLSGRGTLVLRTRKDGDRYTSGAVNTRGKFERAFGYFVARCKLPEEPGHWPAFWMMCSGVGAVGNQGRDGTEIDIMECPWRNGKVTFNLHWDGYGKDHQSAGTNVTITALTEGFHDYGLLWSPEEYVFYVDGREVWRTRAGGVSQVPEYLKLTEEIGKWGGDITKARLPDYFEVDYVRVYGW